MSSPFLILLLLSTTAIGFLSYAVLSLRSKLRAQKRLAGEEAGRDEERDRIFDLSLDMMTATSLDGYVIVANPQFEKTLGWTHEELCAKHILELVHPDDQGRTAAEFARLNEGVTTLNFQNRALCR